MFECADAGYVNSCVRTVFFESWMWKWKFRRILLSKSYGNRIRWGSDCFLNSPFACILSTEKLIVWQIAALRRSLASLCRMSQIWFSHKNAEENAIWSAIFVSLYIFYSHFCRNIHSKITFLSSFFRVSFFCRNFARQNGTDAPIVRPTSIHRQHIVII